MSEFRAGFLSVKREVGVGAGAGVGVDHFFLKNAAIRLGLGLGLGWTIILTLTLTPTLKISSILKKGWTPTPWFTDTQFIYLSVGLYTRDNSNYLTELLESFQLLLQEH